MFSYFIAVLSSDDFELVENSEEEENVETGSKEEVDEGEEVTLQEKKNSEDQSDEKEDSSGDSSKGKDQAKESDGKEEKKGEEESESKEITNENDLGFHIKSYEEILREKALRKMLERRQQLQSANGTDNTMKSDDVDDKNLNKTKEDGKM